MFILAASILAMFLIVVAVIVGLGIFTLAAGLGAGIACAIPMCAVVGEVGFSEIYGDSGRSMSLVRPIFLSGFFYNVILVL